MEGVASELNRAPFVLAFLPPPHSHRANCCKPIAHITWWTAPALDCLPLSYICACSSRSLNDSLQYIMDAGSRQRSNLVAPLYYSSMSVDPAWSWPTCRSTLLQLAHIVLGGGEETRLVRLLVRPNGQHPGRSLQDLAALRRDCGRRPCCTRRRRSGESSTGRCHRKRKGKTSLSSSSRPRTPGDVFLPSPRDSFFISLSQKRKDGLLGWHDELRDGTARLVLQEQRYDGACDLFM